MANAWDDYAAYDAQPTLALRLSMAQSMAAELRKSITATFKADGLEANTVQLRLLLDMVQKDIRRYERQSRPTRVVPIRGVNRF